MKKTKHSTFDIRHPTSNEPEGAVWEFDEEGKQNRKYDLEERLLEFASAPASARYPSG